MAKQDKDNADRLRQDIDHGRAGDKVDFSDPAAAPLGTDDEAAGTPPSEEQLRRAREAEVRGRPADDSTGRDDRTVGELQGARQRGPWPFVAIAAVALLVVLVLVLA